MLPLDFYVWGSRLKGAAACSCFFAAFFYFGSCNGRKLKVKKSDFPVKKACHSAKESLFVVLKTGIFCIPASIFL